MSLFSKSRTAADSAAAPGQPAANSPPPAAQRRLVVDGLHVFTLSSLAFSGPILDRLAKRDPFLSHFGLLPLLLLVALLCLVIPGLLVLIEQTAERERRVSRHKLHAVFLFAGFTALALPICKQLQRLPPVAVVALGMAAGLVATWWYFRSPRWRSVLTWASPAVLIFPGLFLYHVTIARPAYQLEGVPRVDIANPVPIVMVTFDEFCGTSLLDADRKIDAARYPHLSALARDSTWFRNASSVFPATEMAVPAILTGKAECAGSPDVSRYPVNLFTLLMASGKYEFAVFEPYTNLCPPVGQLDQFGLWQQLQTLIGTLSSVYFFDLLPNAPPFDWFEPPLPWYGVWPSELWTTEKIYRNQRTGVIKYPWYNQRTEQFDHFLDCLQPSRRPMLYFTHLALPHLPWCFLPSGKQYKEYGDIVRDRPNQPLCYGAFGKDETWGADDLAIAQSYQRYLLQVGYVDHSVGRLVARLKESGLYDKCLLILVADHGVSFRQNLSRRAASGGNLADIMSVPLLIKRPGEHEGTISDRNVETIDVLPTIADVLGLKLPYQPDGASAFSPEPERAEKVFYNDKEQLREDASFESKYATLQEMLARFGTGATPEALYRIGPNAGLLGRNLDELDTTAKTDVQLRLEYPASFRVDESSPLLPCLLEGKLQAPAGDQPVELAIAVNGVIRAVTRTYALPDLKDTWTAIVPETALLPGENDVQIFVVSHEPRGLTLARCFPPLP